MKLKILGSSSKGNSYILESDTSALIIEAGVSIKKVKKALGFDFNKIKGCIITHSHGDHSKFVNEYLGCGVDVYMSEKTNNELSNTFDSKPAYVLEPKLPNSIGDFKIMPFFVKHDVPCFGYLIRHEECGKVLFVTDTAYIPYCFNDLNQIIIEANYDDEIIDSNVINGRLPKWVRDRIIKSHMSLDTCKNAIKANNLTNVNNIVLIHLSDGNSDSKKFKKDVEAFVGKKVTIADKEVEIEFNITNI